MKTVLFLFGAFAACVVSGAEQLDVRVRQGAGGPRIEVDGVPVPPRMFYGVNNSRAITQGSDTWTRHECSFVPSTAADRSSIHFRFDQKDNAEVWLRNVTLEEEGTGPIPGFKGSFASPAAFEANWKIWPPRRTCVQTFEDGVCHVRLHAPRDGVNDDYHFYSTMRPLRKGAKYTLSFEVKGRDCGWIRPACYAITADGVHTGVPFSDAEGSTLLATVKKAAAADVHFVTYATPGIWNEDGLDFEAFDSLTDSIIAANPKVRLIPRISVNAPRWWLARHPDHRMGYSPEQNAVGRWSGKKIRPEMATVSSRLYRKAANDYIAAVCRHLMERYPRNFAGIHPTGQNTHEWFYFDSWQKLSGWDPQTEAAFRDHLGNPTATVPSFAERAAGQENLLLDPVKQARCIAFNRFQQKEMTDFVAELARTCRAATEGRKLVVIFYGYAWEFAAHSMGPANSGHYGVENLLAQAKGAIDILCSPISYYDRFKCGSAPNMSAGETVMRSGVLWLNEDDTRTYLTHSARARTQEGDRVNLPETCNLLLRNTAQEAIRGFGSWWMDLPGAGWYDARELWDVQKALMPLERDLLARETPFTPEVALIQDEESMIQVAHACDGVTGAMVSQLRGTVNRTGAPHGQYLLYDVLRRPLTAKLQIFQSDWVLSDAQVAQLVEQRRKQPAWRVWCYAPAWRNETGKEDPARMERLTGFAFKARPKAAKAAGVFTVVEKPGDEVFARYPDGTPSLIVRRNGWGGADVFAGDPKCLTVQNLRALADRAGVRSYLPADQVGKATLWAASFGKGRQVLSLQAMEDATISVLTGGGEVRDALTGEVLGSGASVSLPLKANQARVLVW